MCKLCENKISQSWSGLMSLKGIENKNIKYSHFLVNKMHSFISNLIY